MWYPEIKTLFFPTLFKLKPKKKETFFFSVEKNGPPAHKLGHYPRALGYTEYYASENFCSTIDFNVAAAAFLSWIDIVYAWPTYRDYE